MDNAAHRMRSVTDELALVTSPVQPLMVVEDLSVRVGGDSGYDIVHGIDLTLDPGEVLGLVGESGSGKTTLALALLGFARRGTEIRGAIRIGGVDMANASQAELRSARGSLISYVPQDPGTALNPSLHIGPQMEEMFRGRHAVDRERIVDLLEQVQLPTTREFLRRYPHQLSGGQLQRVTIAMAMLNRPSVIVFDEPTTGLDVTTQGRVLETIQELIDAERAAAVYVTHDLAVIGSIASRIAVMYSGLLVEEAPTATVLHRSAHPYAGRLVRATPSPTERRPLVGIAGAALAPRERGVGCPFAPRCEIAIPECHAALPEIVQLTPRHRARCLRAGEPVLAAPPVAVRTSPQRPTGDDDDQRLVVVAGLHAGYGSTRVLEGVDVKVRVGDCLALVGESGSGKTTLARCVSGIHAGEVEGYLEFDRKSLPWTTAERTATQLREIQYIFQNPHASFNPRHTIGHSVAHPLVTFGLSGNARSRRMRVRELLDRVALPAGYENRYPGQLSGGERQRAAIARALAAEPRLLVCDEITSALDVSIQASILELLAKLRAETDLTMIFITHHLGVVRAIADHIVILDQGAIVEEGAAEAVLDAPTHPYTIKLLSNTPAMSDLVAIE